ncbi:hypothetical protein MHO82_10495 [Vibrio sp. Of7-15]|nr:hypothetical protein [Vibrio sp. Of7-15]MCG7497296.1 hypothetical protein [Vibrio sp. Of7-15]
MELTNEKGETTRLADDLTLKEMVDMGFMVELTDNESDSNEHWQTRQEKE